MCVNIFCTSIQSALCSFISTYVNPYPLLRKNHVSSVRVQILHYTEKRSKYANNKPKCVVFALKINESLIFY